MSASNGERVITIGKKGRVTFRFGEDGQPFTLDVIEVNNQWSGIDREYRDEKGEVPADRIGALNQAMWDFTKSVTGHQDVSMAMAMEFMKCITEESVRLKDFFVPKLAKEEPSSPEPSTTLRFST